MGQQQNVADVENVHVQLVPVDVLFAVVGVGAGVLEERPLLGLVVAHDRREGRAAVPADHRKVDVGVLAHLLQQEIAFGVVAGKARGNQMHLRVQPGQVRDGVAYGTAGGGADALGDVGQFVLPGPCLNGVGDVHQHVARAADAFLVGHESSSCSLG